MTLKFQRLIDKLFQTYNNVIAPIEHKAGTARNKGPYTDGTIKKHINKTTSIFRMKSASFKIPFVPKARCCINESCQLSAIDYTSLEIYTGESNYVKISLLLDCLPSTLLTIEDFGISNAYWYGRVD